MQKHNKTTASKLSPADAIHISFFASLSCVSAVFMVRSRVHFVISLLLNACTAHVLSRLLVALPFFRTVRGIPSQLHLLFGVMSLAYIVPSWYKINFPLRALALFESSILLRQVDFYYRAVCYVGQMIVLGSGQIIMLRKSTRTPWDVVQGLSLATQAQFGGILGHFILLTFSLSGEGRSVLGVRYCLGILCTVSILLSTVMTVIGTIQLKKYERMKKEDRPTSTLTKQRHSNLSLMDMLVGVFLDPTKYGQLELEVPPNAKQAADSVLIIVLASQAGIVLNLFNLLTSASFPGMTNPLAAFYQCAATDAFILGFTSAFSFDITLAHHKKISTVSSTIPIGMALLSLSCWVPLAKILLEEEDALDFVNIWKQLFWPMFGPLD